MKCEACGQMIQEGAGTVEYTSLGPVHSGPCPGHENDHQKYVEMQAKNLYIVWRNAMNNSGSEMGIVTREWSETSEEIKKVWYAVTSASLGMYRF
jgi:hypothetical protein